MSGSCHNETPAKAPRADGSEREVTSWKSKFQDAVNKYKEEVGWPSSLEGLPLLRDCIFVGHTSTDLDSIASAVAAEFLFGGVAAAASELNGETTFALKHWNVPAPRPYREVAAGIPEKRRVCLVDHNSILQMAEGIDTKDIVGIIDHHSSEGIVPLESPICVKIPRWGSTCTIIAHMAFRAGVMLPEDIAGILLSGILSDTLNLQAPTTTPWDKKVTAVLAEVADPNDLASKQFEAKAEALNALSDHQVVAGDCKKFAMERPNGAKIDIAWGTVETTSVEPILKRKDALIAEAKRVRTELKVEAMFLSVVDIVKPESFLILAGSVEKSLARLAFPDCKEIDSDLLHLGSRVSRKDFVPPVSTAVNNGWQAPTDAVEEPPLPSMVKCTESGKRALCESSEEASQDRKCARTVSK